MGSEYYDKKYDSLFKEIGKSTFESLAQLAVIEKSIEPGSDNYEESGIPFVRVQDFTKFGIISPKIYLSSTLFKNTIKPKKDTVLLSKDGTVGIAYKTDKDADCITSSAILHLTAKSKKIIPEYLTLVLNSFIVKMQAERDAGGSITITGKNRRLNRLKFLFLIWINNKSVNLLKKVMGMEKMLFFWRLL